MNKNLLKRIIYRSYKRGCRESDIILGNFMENCIDDMSGAQLKQFELFLLEDELQICDWLTQKSSSPQRYEVIVQKIIESFSDLSFANKRL